jgi:hypothetical protein
LVDGFDGVGTSYSSFVPSRCDAKNIEITINYERRLRPPISGRAPSKFAIRLFLVRRTTNEQTGSNAGFQASSVAAIIGFGATP